MLFPMKPSTFLFLVAILLFTNCEKDKPNSKPTYHSFNGVIYEGDNSALMSGDGNLLLSFTDADAAIIKLASDSYTNIIWQYFAATVLCMAETANGEIYACDVGNRLLKLTSSGELLWKKDLNSLDLEQLGGVTNLIPTSDGNLLIASRAAMSEESTLAINLLKVTMDGELLWTKSYAINVVPRHLLEDKDGNYLLTASAEGLYSFTSWIKVRSNGDHLWGKSLDVGACYSTIELDNGDLLACGQTTSNPFSSHYNENVNILLVRLNSGGDMVWSKRMYGGEEIAETGRSIKRNSDGTFTIAGYSYDGGEDETLLLKVDEEGNEIWLKRYKQNGVSREVYNLVKNPTNDDNIIIGVHGFNGGQPTKTFITRIDSEGEVK